jgi:hypothetical protein
VKEVREVNQGGNWIGANGREGGGETRDRRKPRGSRENQVGFDPNKPEEFAPWN